MKGIKNIFRDGSKPFEVIGVHGKKRVLIVAIEKCSTPSQTPGRCEAFVGASPPYRQQVWDQVLSSFGVLGQVLKRAFSFLTLRGQSLVYHGWQL